MLEFGIPISRPPCRLGFGWPAVFDRWLADGQNFFWMAGLSFGRLADGGWPALTWKFILHQKALIFKANKAKTWKSPHTRLKCSCYLERLPFTVLKCLCLSQNSSSSDWLKRKSRKYRRLQLKNWSMTKITLTEPIIILCTFWCTHCTTFCCSCV